MNDPKTRIFVKVKKSSGNSYYDFVPTIPIKMGALGWIYMSCKSIIESMIFVNSTFGSRQCTSLNLMI